MLLEWYLRDGKKIYLKGVELYIRLILKTAQRWLISKQHPREGQLTRLEKFLAIVITVVYECEAKKLCATGLQFRGQAKIVKKYKKKGLSLFVLYASKSVMANKSSEKKERRKISYILGSIGWNNIDTLSVTVRRNENNVSEYDSSICNSG